MSPGKSADFLAGAAWRSRERANLLRRPPKPLSLHDSVLQTLTLKGRAALILEFKRCSPSGFITYVTPWHYIAQVADAADAFSVLTEPYWFCGSPELVSLFAQYRPVLSKDFIVDVQQVRELQRFGASAVLLILDLLSWEGLSKLYDEAISMGVEVLIETSNAGDAVEVMHSFRNALVGINARNLRTLEVDYRFMLREVSRASGRKPSNTLLVAESGIDSIEKAVGLVRAGADALLIGTWAMRKPEEVRQLPKLIKIER